MVHETPLYQLIQYTPTTDEVLETPLVIFPPWINRFYILDLTPEKSFVKWCVDQGITLFMVSWKSADESIADVTLDDYALGGQVDAIDTIRDLLGVEGVHAIGYCVAGTTLAATLAYLQAKKQQDKVSSATFFTAQVDFSLAGDLKLFIGDETMALLEQLTADKGYLDGRYMAATFNLLRGRDLIWNYVVNNYLLGRGAGAVRPAPLEQRHHQPAGRLAPRLSRHALQIEQAGRKRRDQRRRSRGRPQHREDADLHPGRARGPYRAARKRVEGHGPFPGRQALRARRVRATSPAWSIRRPRRNTNIGSTTSRAARSKSFVDGATEHKGSWWPDWIDWLKKQDPKTVAAKGARIPGKGKLKAIEDAPGRYVKER